MFTEYNIKKFKNEILDILLVFKNLALKMIYYDVIYRHQIAQIARKN